VTRCNPYGAENPSGHATPYGGITAATVTSTWVCENTETHRFRWVCERGHKGEIVNLCAWHEGELNGRPSALMPTGRVGPIPPNLRRDVRFCPRCASLAPDCHDPDHQAMLRGRSGIMGRCGCQEPKVRVRLELVS